jgi:hypothetical protein
LKGPFHCQPYAFHGGLLCEPTNPSWLQPVARRQFVGRSEAGSPTVVVPGSEFAASSVNVPFRRVLCAIDFSPASMSALDEPVLAAPVRTDARADADRCAIAA